MAQESAGTGSSFVTSASASQRTTPGQPVPTYVRPTEKTELHNYLFDAFGPYPIAGALVVAGIDQARTSPPEPEWGQGAGGFGARVGSNFGIAAITTTPRYGLAEAFREDALYYQCECKGVFRRLGHAVISTLTARRGDDGHRDLCPRPRFSIRGHDDRGLRMVSEPLRLQGCFPDGQLHFAGFFGAKRRDGIPLWRTALVAFSQPSQ